MLVGDLVIWFYEYLAGIAPDDANPGFKHIVMRPHPVGDLTWVKASFRSPYGLVRSEWQQEGRPVPLANHRAAQYHGHGLRPG